MNDLQTTKTNIALAAEAWSLYKGHGIPALIVWLDHYLVDQPNLDIYIYIKTWIGIFQGESIVFNIINNMR